MLAQFLAAGAGQRFLEIVLAVEAGLEHRAPRLRQHKRRAGAGLQHAHERLHGRAVRPDRIERDRLGQMGIARDKIEHRVQDRLDGGTIDHRRGEIAMRDRRRHQHPRRQQRMLRRADGEGPQAEQRFPSPGQQRHALAGKMALGHLHERRSHEDVRLVRAADEIAPSRFDFG